MQPKPAVLIPSSIQRVRCFINADGRFKIKPWTSVEETLDAFSELLTQQSNDDAFWHNLRFFLGEVSKDLKKRDSVKDHAVDNETLSENRYADLLDEIRTAAAKTETGKGAFERCIRNLSAPAMSTLFLLGGIASLGCTEGTPVDDNETDTSSETDTDADAGDTDSGADMGSDTSTDSDAGANADTETSSESLRSLTEIIRDVVASESEQDDILGCIEGLHDSWHAGLEELFQNKADSEIVAQLNCLMNEYPNNLCDDPEATGEYSLDTLLDNCSVLLYLGVQFE